MEFRRLVVISDTHGGSQSGLTPPEFIPKNHPNYQLSTIFWKWYCKTLKSLGPIHYLVHNADLVDGRGVKANNFASEHFATSWTTQRDIAVQVIEQAKAAHKYVTWGTMAHTCADGIIMEEEVAREVNADLCACQLFLDIAGVIFDFKHEIGGSEVPYGEHTAPSRARLWNIYKHLNGTEPLSKVQVRSHVHYHQFSGNADFLQMTTPCLQGFTRYGGIKKNRRVDIGLISFDIYKDGQFTWHPHLLRVPELQREAVKIW